MSAAPLPEPRPTPHDSAASSRHVGDPVFDLHRGGKLHVASSVPLRDADDLSMAYTPGVARVCLAIAAGPGGGAGLHLGVQHGRRRDRRDRGARARRHRTGGGDARDGGQGGAVQGVRRGRRGPDLPGLHGHRRARRDRSRDSRRASAGSTSRTSRRRDASRSSGVSRSGSTSPSSTTTSTARRSWCSRRCATRSRLVGKDLAEVRIVVLRRRCGRGRGRPRSCWRPASATSRSSTASGIISPRPRRPERRQARRSPRRPTRRDGRGSCRRRAGRRRRLHRGQRRHGAGDRRGADGRRRDRLRARQPQPGGPPRHRAPVRRGRGHGPVGLPEPDQQRAGVPWHLPRGLRRPGARGSPRT